MNKGKPCFLPRDFIETEEGLLFAVVASDQENGRVPSFLRYRRLGSEYCKLSTQTANALLRSTHPEFLFHSKVRDAHLHAVAVERVAVHYRPRERIQSLLTCAPRDAVEAKLNRLLQRLLYHRMDSDCIGVTGSILIGAQHNDSDMDLVIYGRDQFRRARAIVERLIGANVLQPLDEALWRETYTRRGCELSFGEYIWHEQRKHNKAVFEQTKVDLSLLDLATPSNPLHGHKLGRTCIQTRVVGDELGFDYPSRYRVDHPVVVEVVSFTATYAGQARDGECIEACGQLEAADGLQRLVVGSDREAAGEYIKVIDREKR